MTKDQVDWLIALAFIVIVGGATAALTVAGANHRETCRMRFMDKGLRLDAAIEACK